MANDTDDGAWFAPRRFGFGAGLPIRWQGWALLLGTIAVILAVGMWLEDKPALQFAIILPLIIVLMIVAAHKTRGGWRWRWGDGE